MKGRCFIRGYQKGDAFKVRAQKEQEAEAKEFGGFFDDITAYSLCEENKILGVFGYVIDEKNEAYCYGLLSQNAAPYLGFLIRFIKKETALVCDQKKVVKVMMTVKKSFDHAGRFAKLLGYSYAKDLPRFYENEDYQLFERI